MVLKKDKLFNATQFQLDLISVRNKYKDDGFLLMAVNKTDLNFTTDSSLVDIKIFITEGKIVPVGKINFSGNEVLKDKELLKLMETRTGDILSGAKLNNDIKEILSAYEKKGLPFVKVKITDISLYRESDVTKLSLSLDIKEESRITIDKIKITGNDITNDKVILREIKLNKERTITKDNLEDIKARLDKLNIFERVDDPKIVKIKNSNSAELLVGVKEGNNNTFDGVLGYVPPANDQDKGYFTGLINLSFRNIFGTGRRIDARWSQQIRSTQELEFKYSEPYLLNLPLNLNFAFLQRIQDSTYTRRKFDLKGDILLSDKFTVSLIGSYDRIIPSSDSTRTFTIGDSRILSSGIELRYDSRDNIYVPMSGILYTLAYSYGDKKIYNADQLASYGYQQDYSIQRYSVDIDFYSSFFKRQSALIKLFAGEVKTDRLEDGDYFRIGGNKYIRGYREEQFLASTLVCSNIEFRYSLSRKGFFSVFYDFGYYLKPVDNINIIPKQEGFLYGYGIGMRVETGLGILGINYALGKGDGFLDGKINFGIINDF